MRLHVVTTIATIGALISSTFGAAVPKTRYKWEYGGYGNKSTGPKYCEPYKTGPFNSIPSYVYIDFSRCKLPPLLFRVPGNYHAGLNLQSSTDTLSHGLGQCCVTYVFGDAHKPLSKQDLKDIEDLMRHEAGHTELASGWASQGVWQVTGTDVHGLKAVDPKVVDTWAAGIKGVATKPEILEQSSNVESVIFQRGNETIGEEKIRVGRVKF